MKIQSFEEILTMVRKVYRHTFYGDVNSVKVQCIESATKIYIEQMRLEAYGPCVDVSAQSPDNYINDEEDTFF